MKVVYLFQSSMSAMLLENMIIPQIEEQRHGAEVVGMFFFFDNTYFFVPENPIGEKLVRLADKYGFFLICCDKCCEQRGIINNLYHGVEVGCFPDLYKLAEKVGAQQVITL
jgi:sulfur relay (sulfurtransferase) complex TusBCD TusD component (DsrE family)